VCCALGLCSGSMVRMERCASCSASRPVGRAHWAGPSGPDPMGGAPFGQTQWAGPEGQSPWAGPDGPRPLEPAPWAGLIGPAQWACPNGPGPMGRAQMLWAQPNGPPPIGPNPTGLPHSPSCSPVVRCAQGQALARWVEEPFAHQWFDATWFEHLRRRLSQQRFQKLVWESLLTALKSPVQCFGSSAAFAPEDLPLGVCPIIGGLPGHWGWKNQ